MIVDGLWDAFNWIHMGMRRENVAKEYGISRAAQDEFAALSQDKAEAAQESGSFRRRNRVRRNSPEQRPGAGLPPTNSCVMA